MERPATCATNMPGRSRRAVSTSTHSQASSSATVCGLPNAPAATARGNQGHAGNVAFLGPAGDDPQAFGLRRLRFRFGPNLPEPPVGLRGQPLAHDLPEGRIVHVADEDLLVLVHPLHEQAVDQAAEHQLELACGIDRRGLPQLVIGGGRRDELVEEELVGLDEVGTEPFR